MKDHVRSIMAVLFLAIIASAGESPKQDVSRAQQLAAILKAHKEAEAAFQKTTSELPDTPEGEKKYEELRSVFDKAQAERFIVALELAKSDPKSDVGFAALEWILTIPRSYYSPAGRPAMELVTKHHATNPKVGKIVVWVGHFRPREGDAQPAADALIKNVAEKNPHRVARGQAVFAIASEVKGKFAVAEYKKAPDREQLATEAERMFEVILKDYADCPRGGSDEAETLGARARAELFELRHLRVGKIAPEIEGEDLDGIKFKLSDYRGKVVVLDFWGDW